MLASRRILEPLLTAFVANLPIGVEIVQEDETDGLRTYTLRLSVGEGVALLHVQRTPQGHSDAWLTPETARSGALFWRALARWLRVPVVGASQVETGRLIPIRLVSMGVLPSKDGDDWRALKLFIRDPHDVDEPSELYLNVSNALDRGELCEQDTAMRPAIRVS